MNERTIATVWLECPVCHWRREYPQQVLSGAMRCRKCNSTVLVSAPETEPATQPADDLTLEPVDLPPASGMSEVIAVEPEYQLAPATTPAIPADIASKVLPGSAPIETKSDVVVPSPAGAGIGWAFTSNVLLFPWTLSAIVQWCWAAIFSVLAVFVGVLTAPIVARFLNINSLAGPVILVPAILLGLLSLTQLSACLIDIVINAAYNCDLETEWPEPEIKERFWYLVRLFYLFVIVSMPSAVIAEICFVATGVFWPVYGASMFVLFPISLLAVLETDSPLTPISRPIFRSLWGIADGWLAFYCLTALLLAAVFGISYYAITNWGAASALIIGPLGAAAIFIYGRLLGRLAWLIMENDEAFESTSNKPAGRYSSGQPAARQIGRRRDRRARQLFRGLPE